MNCKSFDTEADALDYAASERAVGRIVDDIYPPSQPGAKNGLGRWIVWSH